VNLGDTAACLGVRVEDIDRVHRLAGVLPSAPLPAKADAPALLDRLAVRPDDAAEIMAGWPDPGSPRWTPELRWLLDRVTALVRADLIGLDAPVRILAQAVRPATVRSLDAIHLGTALHARQVVTAFVTYDKRLLDAALTAGLPAEAPA
jgi:hypothetical protein